MESAIPASGTRAGASDSNTSSSPLAEETPRGAPEDSHRPDFVWPRLAGRFAAVLEETTVADLCRDAAREAVPRADHVAYSYEI